MSVNGDGSEEFAGCGFSHLSFPARALPVFARSSKCYNTNLQPASVTIPIRCSVTIADLRPGPVNWERVKLRGANSVLVVSCFCFESPVLFLTPCPGLVWSPAPLLDHIGQMCVLQCTMACHFTIWRSPHLMMMMV